MTIIDVIGISLLLVVGIPGAAAWIAIDRSDRRYAARLRRYEALSEAVKVLAVHNDKLG